MQHAQGSQNAVGQGVDVDSEIYIIRYLVLLPVRVQTMVCNKNKAV